MIRSLFCTRPENRTPIARLRILSTNRYTSRACFDLGLQKYGNKSISPNLFQKNEENSENKQEKCHEMIPLQGLVLEKQGHDDCKDCQ